MNFEQTYRTRLCVVTGSEGFKGKALCNRLKKLGATIIGIDIKNGTDIRNLQDLEHAFRYGPDYVFHMAALTEVKDSFSRPHDYYTTNVLGTLNILEMCRVYQPKMLVIASTDKAYGNRHDNTLPYREDDLLIPSIEPYGNTKRHADNIALDYANIYNLPLRMLRCCNVYGPGQHNQTTLITNTINKLLNDCSPELHDGTRNKIREWLYIDDAINAYLRAGEVGSFYGRVWNVGSGERYTATEIVLKLIDQIEGTSSQGIARSINVQFNDCMRVGNQEVNCNLFQNHYENWNPIKIDDGLKKTIEWHRARREIRTNA